MLKQILRSLIESSLIAIVMVGVASAIWFFRKESGSSFQDILFWVAVSPIVFFSIGQITTGNSSELDLSYQKSKSLIDEPSVDSSIGKFTGNHFGLKVIVAGAIVLVFSLVVQG